MTVAFLKGGAMARPVQDDETEDGRGPQHPVFRTGRRILPKRPARPEGRRLRRPRPGPRPLGQVLIERGVLDAAGLEDALDRQAREDARLGDILLANGMVSESELYLALADRHQTVVADLDREPPDVRMIDEIGSDFCIRHGIVPWKRVGGAIILICSQPDEFPAIRARLPETYRRARFAVAPEREIRAALIAMRHRVLAARAETRVHEDISCRTWKARSAGQLGVAILFALVAVFAVSPFAAFALLTAWAVMTLTINSGLKLVAAVIHLRHRQRVGHAKGKGAHRPVIFEGERLPAISILVPLFKEREIAGRLVKRLGALDYPRALIDICLVVEEDDTLTQDTLARSDLPPWMRQVIVPRGTVRTKPRAMNFALDFCRGSIIGIYDAEDAPAADQIQRIVARFQEAGPNVACLQGVLTFYNDRTNWLSRCFTIEYATWFRIVLPGLERMGFAVPLGGTTAFFRRAPLESLGGWDAHNVTEDADLGVRLARAGYTTELIDTVTGEEANCRAWPWVKQRSRWIKGYAMTYGVHMRRPGQLLADMGWWKFMGVQFLFLGTLSQFLLAPILWSFWLVAFGLPHPLTDVLPGWMFIILGATFLASEALTIAVGVLSVNIAGRKYLRWWVPTMHFYFPLASLAAAKGFVEIIAKPFYWDKTEHGYDDQARDALATVTQSLEGARV